MTDATIKELLELIYHEPAEYLLPSDRAALVLLLKQYPGLEKVFRELLANENPGGTTSACTCFEGLISEMSSVMSYTRDPNYWRINVGERDAAPEELLVRAWAIGSVRQELGSAFFKGLSDEDILDGFIDMRIMMYGDSNRPDHSTDINYWRGMAVLRPIYVEIDYEFDVHNIDEAAHQFALWAGMHPNLHAVADTAMTRRTIDAETLQELISQAETVPALGDGAL